jgi:KDO2-lipid IV(A) lauroyltransferase
MKKIGFYLFYILVRLVSLLPFPLIYGISSAFYPLIYYVFPYRKKTVFKNLRNSFPEKNEKEIKKIARDFYKHLCDSFLESVVYGFKPIDQMLRRFRVINPELCNELYKKKKSISLMMAHYGNWEYAAFLPAYIKHLNLAIYKPLRNKHFDQYVRKNRERIGVQAVALEKILKNLILYQQKDRPTITYFIADQRPLMAKIQYWTTFLHQDTPVVMGPEKIAHHFNHAVLFLQIKKVKRGYYEAEFIKIADEANNLEKYEIIENYHSILEKLIREEPAFWLWSHNRWKHDKEDYYRRKAAKKK